MKESVIVFGCGNSLKNNIDWIMCKYEIKCLCDNDRNKWGEREEFGRLRCISPDELNAHNERIIISSAKTRDYKDIKLQLEQMGKKVIDIYRKDISESKKYRHMYIWGAANDRRFIDAIITNFFDDVVIDGYTTHLVKELLPDGINGKECISLTKAKTLIEKGKCDGIVIAANKMEVSSKLNMLIESESLADYNLYLVPKNIFYETIDDKCIERIFTLYRDFNRVRNIQFLITNKCNLNYRLCSHFSPLAKNDSIYNFDIFKKDLYKIRELVDEIDELGLWGGETLLCDNLEIYIQEIRKLFPYSRIVIGTNGLKLLSISEALINSIRDNDVMFAISLYPPTLGKIDEIKAFLDCNKIKARYPGTIKIEQFIKRFEINGNNNYEEKHMRCVSRACTTVRDGKISGCYFPICAKYFNEYFPNEKHFDVEDDCIDLHSADRNLFKRLNEPMKSCRYCGYVTYEDWSIAPINPKPSDFVRV